jgi:hypothetical protein
VTASVSALFVQRGGVYWDRLDVDAWDEERDARNYAGDLPVVAHPPCSRWCRLAKFNQHLTGGRLEVGDDKGCFASALFNVRRCGGVLEHPAWSIAWAAHGLAAPPERGWHLDIDGGWCCEVSQAAYGHRARKLTWLYYFGRNPPEMMDWSRPEARGVVSGLRNNCGRPLADRVWKREASATKPAFAEVLLGLARNCGGPH